MIWYENSRPITPLFNQEAPLYNRHWMTWLHFAFFQIYRYQAVVTPNPSSQRQMDQPLAMQYYWNHIRYQSNSSQLWFDSLMLP